MSLRAFRNCQDPFLQLVTVSRDEKIFIENENIKGEKGKGENKEKNNGGMGDEENKNWTKNNIERDRQTDEQTDKQTDKQTNRQTDRQTDKKSDRDRDRDKERENLR